MCAPYAPMTNEEDHLQLTQVQ